MLHPFHLAIPVSNLEACRLFYHEVLGCEEGRRSDQWVDFNFFGHQLVIHETSIISDEISNPVDGKSIPVPHYGIVLDMKTFENLSESLRNKNLTFIIEPYIRFKGQIGEQATMFFKDPSGNAIEFKAFKNMDQLFAK